MTVDESFDVWRSVLPDALQGLSDTDAWKLRSQAAAQYWLGADPDKEHLVELFDKYVMMKRLTGDFDGKKAGE
jgi:hypothetical protein